jgi:hypothetical protein
MRDRRHGIKRSIGALVLMALTALSLQTPARAGMVGTAAVIDGQQASLARGRLLAALDRDDVRKQLEALGVDPQAAQQRVAALSDEEIRSLDGRIQNLPAGGDVLAVALIVFLVLLLTDILGYTNVFPFVKKTVH